MTGRDLTVRLAASAAMLASAVWLGGLVILGAVVAPTVFRNVPAPHSADAMTLVFQRFDGVAMTCAAVVVVAEAVGTLLGRQVRRVDAVRYVAALGASGFAVWEAMALAPKIAELHRGGAIRGLDAAGIELERVHKLAELAGKAEVALLVVYVVVRVLSVPSRSRSRKAD